MPMAKHQLGTLQGPDPKVLSEACFSLVTPQPLQKSSDCPSYILQVLWENKQKGKKMESMVTAVGVGRDPKRKVRLWEELESCAPDRDLTKTSSCRAVLRLWVCFPSHLSDNDIPHLHVHTISEPIHHIRHHPMCYSHQTRFVQKSTQSWI